MRVSKVVMAGVMAVVMCGLSASAAMAQRDAGAKARGEFGVGNFQRNAGRSGRTFNMAPAQASDSSGYRSFSYEPVGIHAGDTVYVHGNDVKMMKGDNVVGALPDGTQFTVTKEVNGWLGTQTDVNGQTLNGWVWHNNVSPSQSRQAARDIRRFSFEPDAQGAVAQPAPQVRSFSSGGRYDGSINTQPKPPFVRLHPGSRR